MAKRKCRKHDSWCECPMPKPKKRKRLDTRPKTRTWDRCAACKRPFLRLVEDNRRYCYTRCGGGDFKKRRVRLDSRAAGLRQAARILRNAHRMKTSGSAEFHRGWNYAADIFAELFTRVARAAARRGGQ